MTIYTIGHSTRSLDEFIALLTTHRIDQLADIRTVPRSRRHPHFSGDALAVSLPAAGIAYRHFKSLGGLRKPRRDSINSGWRHEGFRGYADYMQTDEFERAIQELLAWAAGDEGPARRTAIMCAEAVWWRCHRQLVADALIAGPSTALRVGPSAGIEVRHITSAAAPAVHALTDFARITDGRVTYPGLV
jgi:uncharacterized protein (DUF488 family)